MCWGWEVLELSLLPCFFFEGTPKQPKGCQPSPGGKLLVISWLDQFDKASKGHFGKLLGLFPLNLKTDRSMDLLLREEQASTRVQIEWGVLGALHTVHLHACWRPHIMFSGQKLKERATAGEGPC